MVVKDELLAANPGLAADIFDAFVRAKEDYLDRLKAGAIAKPTEIDELHTRVADIIGDPLPYGIAPNRKVLEELLNHAMTQRIITNRMTVEELFAPGTYELVG
jgi:4,5-dihydroxyphthalate decarboxylase